MMCLHALYTTDPSARPIPPPVNSDGSCTSQETESVNGSFINMTVYQCVCVCVCVLQNIPAAHVKGHGVERGKWIQSTEESGT